MIRHRGLVRRAFSVGVRYVLSDHALARLCFLLHAAFLTLQCQLASGWIQSTQETGELEEGKEKVKSCLTLCDPMDYTVHGILQARILERVAFPFSKGSLQPWDQTQVSHIAGGFFTS